MAKLIIKLGIKNNNYIIFKALFIQNNTLFNKQDKNIISTILKLS